jgi:L-seryl-tRNA(Ser) seleniumtransferase
VRWDEAAFGFTVADCVKHLSEGEPRVEVLSASNPSMVPAVLEGDNKTPKKTGSRDRLQIVPSTLQPGEELLVGKRLREILAGARSRAPRQS